MVRLVLVFLLIVFVVRALWRLLSGVIDGIAGRPPSPGGLPGVQMVRDPVCGTFVVPNRAVALMDGSRQVYFCSAACRDQYRARPSTSSGRPERGQGRTA